MQVTDPLASPIDWPGPSITSIEQPLTLGVYPDGSTILIDLSEDHVLVGGGTNQGKSAAVNVIIGDLVSCDDVQILGIDMKPGALELGPWRKNLLMLADNAEQARQVLAAVKAEMIRRGQYLATLRGPNGEPVRKWTSKHGPYWVLIIDELAELLRQAPDVLNELVTINQVARAMGIRVVAATQSPSEQAFGGKGTDARQQYGTRVGLPVHETTPINMIYGAGALGAGWRLDWLDKPGKVMVSSARYGEPNEGRCYWMSDARIVATSNAHATANPGPGPEPEDDPTPPAPRGGGPGGIRPTLRSVPVFPNGEEIPGRRVPLWRALQQAGDAGLTLNDVVAMDLDGYAARTSVQAPLAQWAAKGWVDDTRSRDRAKVYRLITKHVPVLVPAKETSVVGR
nr:FtsK/SpoIIIE domain-containing protein [Streptomyces sp. SID13666]